MLTKVQISGDELGSKTSVDTTRRKQEMQMPTQQSSDMSKFKKFSFMDEHTVFRATVFVARIKSALEHPKTLSTNPRNKIEYSLLGQNYK